MRAISRVLTALAISAAIMPLTARAAGPFSLRAADFMNGAPMPTIHEGNIAGCTGKNVAPSLSWSGAPMGTLSFALTELDPDIPKSFSPIGFPHWVVYNIPATATSITPKSVMMYTSGKMGLGQFSFPGYHGPCPTLHGPAHHYHFTLYALNVGHLAGKALNYVALQQAIKGHVLGKATLIGTFARP